MRVCMCVCVYRKELQAKVSRKTGSGSGSGSGTPSRAASAPSSPAVKPSTPPSAPVPTPPPHAQAVVAKSPRFVPFSDLKPADTTPAVGQGMSPLQRLRSFLGGGGSTTQTSVAPGSPSASTITPSSANTHGTPVMSIGSPIPSVKQRRPSQSSPTPIDATTSSPSPKPAGLIDRSTYTLGFNLLFELCDVV